MMDNVIKNKKGSTMLFVLIAISVLSLLGVSLLSLAVSGLKVKLSERNIKESQYLSESGLDQAYILICKDIKAAIDASKNVVDSFIDTEKDVTGSNVEYSLEAFLDKERLEEKNSPEDPAQEGYYDSPYLEGTSGKGDVIEEELKELFNKKFKASYKALLDSKLTEAQIIDEANYVGLQTSSTEPTISVLSSKPYVVSGTSSDTSELILKSNYLHNNITKELSVKLVITVPNYDQEYTVETVSMVESPFFNKILAADGSIVVKGRNTTIKGDVYAGGDSALPVKGIALGDKATDTAGELSIRGRIVTGGDISIQGSNSSFQADGDIYCNNIRFEDIDNSRVTVGNASENFNVHTLNSIILDGTGSLVDIKGRYYGFSNGSDMNASRSSIFINDQYASGAVGGTHINISGEAAANSKFPDEITEKPEGNVIAGSNFVPFGEVVEGGVNYKVLYQTGESVAIIGNYRAYSSSLTDNYPYEDTDGITYNFNNIWTDTISDKAQAMALGFNNPSATRYFGGTGPEYATMADGSRYKLFKGAIAKGYYLQHAYEEAVLDGDADYYRFDSTSGIKNVIYSMGAFPVESSGTITVSTDNHNLNAYGLLPNLLREYKYYVNELGDPSVYYEDAGETRNSVAKFIDETVSLSNTTPTVAAATNELYYSGDEVVAIGSMAAADLEVPGSAVKYVVNTVNKGVIYTTKDVYITGNLTYNGTIITKGNIYINGDAAKSINNNPSGSFNLEELIFEDYINNSNGIGDIFKVSVITENEKYTSSTGTENYINFKELVELSNWRRIR